MSRKAWPRLGSDKGHSEGNGQMCLYSTGLKHSYPVPAAAQMAPSSSEEVPSRMKVDGVLGSIHCSPFPRKSQSSTLSPAEDSRTSSLWNCFRVGCAQEVTKATNFQLGEMGWEKSPDGVVPSMGKMNCVVVTGVYRMSACTGKWLSREPVPCLPVSRASSGQVFVLTCWGPAVWDSCTYPSRNVVCQRWTAPMSRQ